MAPQGFAPSTSLFGGFSQQPFLQPQPSQQSQQQQAFAKPSTGVVNSGKLYELIQLQKANGSWVLDTSFAAAVGVTLKKLQDAKNSAGAFGLSDSVWACVVAVVFLENAFKGVQDMWALITEKAKKFAVKEGASWDALCDYARKAQLV